MTEVQPLPVPDGVSGRSRIAAAFALAAWVGLLTAVIVGFSALGSGALAAPPLTEPSAWQAWARSRESVQVAFTLGRLAVIALAWYLLGVTVVGAAARLLRWGRAVRLADLLTVPAVRRLLQSALGVGLATAALTTLPAGGQAGPRAPTAAAVELAEAREDALAVGGQAYALMRPLDGQAATESMQVLEDAPVQPGGRQATTWTVRPGEHFWAIAERVLTRAWGRSPSDAEVVPYWRQVIELNRVRLADPGNPDLVYPGQQFALPPPPPPPGG